MYKKHKNFCRFGQMVSLSALRAALNLSPANDDLTLNTLDEALRALPALPLARVQPAFMRLLAESLLPHLPALNELLRDLESTASRPQAEADVARWLAQVTGGAATVRSSWGDTVAAQGAAHTGPTMRQALVYEDRVVGQLELSADPRWQPLLALTARQMRQVRLTAAAAGAARRRVGERQFEALLSGDSSGVSDGGPCALAALRFDQPLPRAERARASYLHRLDTLCSAGEGYFHGRGVACLTTVRGDKALWLWQSQHLEQDVRGLHQALLTATQEATRLGVSGLQSGFGEAAAALRQATQALSEVSEARGVARFQHLDPLQTLLHSQALHTLSEQLRGLLRGADEDGKLEETLRRYLNHHGPLGELAAAMNLHVNTLRYRLRRAEELLGGQLSDPAFVTRLYLAFHAQGAAEGEE